MELIFRNGKFDVILAASPRVTNWPSTGVRSLSALCARMGLTVGQFGGDSLHVKGVLPLTGTGGLVLVEDIQKRIHRIQARAIVKISGPNELPDPFPGWASPALLPLTTAERILEHDKIMVGWDPLTVVLGTGNRALRFASRVLEQRISNVICVESNPERWGSKRFSGWEVERRHFEMLGGKIIEAIPVRFTQKTPHLWQLDLQMNSSSLSIDVSRVVSAGPFSESNGIREYPPGSFLFEFQQTATETYTNNIEGWLLEEERGKWLAGKIIRSLVTELSSAQKDELDRVYLKAKNKLKRYFKHRVASFQPKYEGKWINKTDAAAMKSFSGVPQRFYRYKPIASVECFEEISCNLCQKVCPTSAIKTNHLARTQGRVLDESACIGCGLCVSACPSSSIPLIYEKVDQSTALLTLPWKGPESWKVGELALLMNRRGESLGSGRVKEILPAPVLETLQEAVPASLIQIEVPSHLAWDARAIKKNPVQSKMTEPLEPMNKSERVEVTLNGERRLLPDQALVSLILFENNLNRVADNLLCPDGSCGRCTTQVDGLNQLSCQTRIRRGMAIRTDNKIETFSPKVLCPCLNISAEEVIDRIKQGKLQSPEAIRTATHVGEGTCQGQSCLPAFRRMLIQEGIQSADEWIDWRFPWSSWLLGV